MRGTRLLVAAAWTVCTGLLSAASSQGDAAVGPLPPCTFGDLAATIAPHDDGRWTVMDTVFRLPSTWEPTDLVTLRAAGFDDDRSIRAVVIDDLRSLREAAEAAGVSLEVQSAYRSFAYQATTFQRWVDALGVDAALSTSARAGHSEHQLGTALDLRTAGGPAPWEVPNWADTREGAWMVEHAPSFGFLMSYPEGTKDVTCYDFEPWHWRWVGRELAAKVAQSGMTLRAFLWSHRFGVDDPSERAP